MKEDDEQEDASSSAITRYPCMPSLVALQQMRNRLHLAFVGKKLMKWTAQATGRELRKLAKDLIISSRYGTDMKDAFILLARARYFYPNLNKMVLEHIGHAANITIDVSTKSISGVKVLHLELIDTGQDTYQHLGIDKGGQAILAAKIAWRKLLYDVIRFMEQREAFHLLDIAHRTATKKKNVLVKIIIPKLKRTIKFIVSELEEFEREEVFRLKRFKQLKTKQAKKPETHICCCCLSMFDSEEDEVESTCPGCKKAAQSQAQEKQPLIRPKVAPVKRAEAKGNENIPLLDHLMTHIDGVIELANQFKLGEIVPTTIDKFIRTCSQIKETIEDYANTPRCDLCNKVLEATSSGVQLALKMPSSKSLNVQYAPKMTEKILPSTESCFNLSTEHDDKLGYFENKFKEIVKVTKFKNEDGSVSVEKQVITIKTETRMPKKNGAFDSKNIAPGGLGGCGGRQNYNNGKDYSGGTDNGGDGGQYSSRPRETKSESNNRSHQMGETKLRSCMSESYPKSTMNKDASTNIDSSDSIKNSNDTVPYISDLERVLGPLPKVSKASSIDPLICCPRTASVCGSQLESGPPSQKSMVPDMPVTTTSAQTRNEYIKEVQVRKPMKDQSSYAAEERKCYDKSIKFKTTPTDAVWRDAWTSTTGLATEPSRTPNQGPSRPTSKPCTRKSSPVSSITSKDSAESTEKPQKKGNCCNRKSSPVSSSTSKDSAESTEKPQKKGNCCTIKIIPKPPKIIKPKQPEKEIVLPGSMFETIKSIFLPPTRSNESCKVDPNPPKEPVKKADIKNICSDCLSKLSSLATSVKPSIISESFCKMCQTSMTAEVNNPIKQPEPNICKTCQSKMSPSVKSQSSCEMCQACMTQETETPSCGSLAISSSSCKSLGVGSSTHICQKPSTPSLHSQKHTCCLEKKSRDSDADDDDENTCCAMAQTNKSSKSICCSKEKTSSVCCPAKSSNTSVKSSKSSGSCTKAAKTSKSASGSCPKADATTCTKRSARFDVRPLRRHTCEKINMGACTCRSDPNANRRTVMKPVKRSKSFYEDEYYYFKW